MFFINNLSNNYYYFTIIKYISHIVYTIHTSIIHIYASIIHVIPFKINDRHILSRDRMRSKVPKTCICAVKTCRCDWWTYQCPLLQLWVQNSSNIHSYHCADPAGTLGCPHIQLNPRACVTVL